MTEQATTLNVGAERIEHAIRNARGRAALMPYMMGGYPDHETSVAIGHACVDGGADLIELGIPYSDPLADGPVIQSAGTVALAAFAAAPARADDRSDCRAGIEMIESEIAKRPAQAILADLQTALGDAEREEREGEFDECLDAVDDARAVLARR